MTDDRDDRLIKEVNDRNGRGAAPDGFVIASFTKLLKRWHMAQVTR